MYQLFDGYAHIAHDVFEVPDLPFRSPNGSPLIKRSLSCSSNSWDKSSVTSLDTSFDSESTLAGYGTALGSACATAEGCRVSSFVATHEFGSHEFKAVANAFKAWGVAESPWRVTRWGKPVLFKSCTARHGVDSQTRSEINTFLAQRKLGELSDLQAKHGGHYLVYENGSLSTYMCTLTAEFKTNFKIAVSVEWLASASNNSHTASILVEELKAEVLKRAQKSWVVTQALTQRKAFRWWQGKLTISTYAYALVGLMHVFDENYIIQSDCRPMCV